MAGMKKKIFKWCWNGCYILLFWPLIVAGGRLALRVVFNLWSMIES